MLCEGNRMHSYSGLLSEGKIGSLILKNRLIMGPIETLYGSACGEVTPQVIAFYRKRALGGVGLIVLHSVQGNASIDQIDPYAGSLRLDNNAFLPMMSDLTEAVHSAGAKIAALVSVGGGCMSAGERYITSLDPRPLRVAPSVLPDHEGVRQLSEEDVYMLVDNYGRCAGRAKAAGFDAFVIHAVGQYLLAEFLSPHFNKRKDKYGGSAENRWRLLFELIDSCKHYAGESFPLIVRLAVDEGGHDGRTLEETIRFISKLEEKGVDAIDITAGTFDASGKTIPSIYVSRGVNLEYAQKIKSTTKLPIIFSGKLQEPEYADKLISEGTCDFISISRALLAEPDLPRYIMNGQLEKIRKCISCNYCIGHRIRCNLPIRCAINPEAGREWVSNLAIKKDTLSGKRAVIIGGGPAGLEAAVTLANSSCLVDIFEQEHDLCGGQLHTASIPPFKQALKNIKAYYFNLIQKSDKIKIHVNTLICEDDIENIEADYIIFATGGSPVQINIPGISGECTYTAQDALLGRCKIGSKVLIIGGGQIGAETALFLAQENKSVTIVEMQKDIAAQEEPMTRSGLVCLLEHYQVNILTQHKVKFFKNYCACIQDTSSGSCCEVQFDTVLLALGTRSNDELYNYAKKRGKKAYIIGDAAKVGNLATAISSARLLAMSLLNEEC